jgi:hypothetical protein
VKNVNAYKIPQRSFGRCNWCGEESCRLSFLMCTNCFRIANMIPSKTMVLLNQPDVKRALEPTGTTIRHVAPHLRMFLEDPRSKFPHEKSDLKLWEAIKKEMVEFLSPGEIRNYRIKLIESDVQLPDEDELAFWVGSEKYLQFVLRVAVIRGELKMDFDPEDEDFFQKMIEVCTANTMNDTLEGLGKSSEQKLQIDTDKKSSIGMNTRDITLKKRGKVE